MRSNTTTNLDLVVRHVETLKAQLDEAHARLLELQDRVDRDPDGVAKSSWPEVKAAVDPLIDFFGSIRGPALNAVAQAIFRV